MDFNTKGHEVSEKGEYVSAYLKPGIHTAKITNIAYGESRGGTPKLVITHETKPVEGLEGKGQIATTEWWMSEKAWPYTKDRLVVMADKLEVRETLDNITASDASNYCMALNGAFTNKAARWKFSGEEIKGGLDNEGNKKNDWWKASLAGFGFCESLSISEENSELKFDESNKYDMTPLKAEDKEEVSSSENNGESDDSEPWS
tara:strand:+ start:21584 stop:22192 length:609 start_codon:yes stop_codon:yes gene_type:complete